MFWKRKKWRNLALLLAFLLAVSLLPACKKDSTKDSGGNQSEKPVTAPQSVLVSEAAAAFYQSFSALLGAQKDARYFGEIQISPDSREMYIDGQKQTLSAAPKWMHNRLMIPLEALAEAFGLRVSGDLSTGFTISTAYGEEIYCRFGANAISINGTDVFIDAAPYAENGKTYMSLNAVADALELECRQDADQVKITAPYQTARIFVLAGDELEGELQRDSQLRELGASLSLNDHSGIWIFQFDSPSRAKAALNLFTALGYQAGPDSYLALGPESASGNTGSASSDAHRSWGVEHCGYDQFIQGNRLSGGAVVAVVDSGVQADHPFLRGRVLDGFDIVEGDSIPQDTVSHGTHVAGIIIDCTRDAPVQIFPVRVLGDDGCGTSLATAEGIKYAANFGADVINLSLGGLRSGMDSACENAIRYAVEKGALAVIAAGNEDDDTARYDPAYLTIPGTVIVAAGDSNQRKAYFSNYGDSVDLMAPGVNVLSSVSVPQNGYDSYSGTSMATPHAAAAAALVDLATGKRLSPAALEEVLRGATSNHGRWSGPEEGCGFLNLSNADIPASSAPAPKKNPVLASDIPAGVSDLEAAKTYPVFGSGYQRQQIASVTFLSDVKEAGEGKWDVSAERDGSVWAWTERNGSLYDLYLAGDGGVIAPADCGWLFYGYTSLREIHFNGAFHTDNVTNFCAMFSGCSSLSKLDLSGWNTENAENLSHMFRDCGALQSVNLEGFQTGRVTTMACLFHGCSRLSSLDVSAFDTSSVESMYYMFSGTRALSALDVSHFRTSRVTDMRGMFRSCAARTLDVSGFDTSQATSLSYLFAYTPVRALDVRGFDTSQVASLYAMFAGCEQLETLDVRGFDTSAATDIRYMFYNCKRLENLDVSGFDFSSVEQDEGFLKGCPAQRAVEVEPGYYSLKNSAGAYLAHRNAQAAALDGAALSASGKSFDHWWYVRAADGNYHLEYLTEAMSVSNAAYRAGTPVIAFPYHIRDGGNQRWRFWTEDGQSFRLVPYGHSELGVTAGEDGFSLTERDAADLWTLEGADAAMSGNFLAVESGNYRLRHESGQFLSWDGPRFTLSGEAPVWYLEDEGDGYSIRRGENIVQALDLSGGTLKGGNAVITFPFHGDWNQQWKFVSADGKRFRIVPSRGSGLTVAPSADGLEVRDQTDNGAFWTLTKES